MVYTVDEVSAMLGVPRPTLYRYLREYSIPYNRQAGRISIPEDSLSRIRTVRELHDEGLGTTAVRRRLQEGEGVDVDRIAERLDRLSDALESSRLVLKTSDSLPSSQAIPIILARQSLLISAVFNLTEMMEELLTANGRPRRPAVDFLEEESQRYVSGLEETGINGPRAQGRAVNAISVYRGRSRNSAPEPVEAVVVPVRSGGFGTLARRRSATLGVLTAVLIAAALLWVLVASGLLPGFG